MNTIAIIAGFFVMVATTHSFGMLPAIVIGVFVGGMVRVFLSVFRGTGNAPVTNPQESAFAETVSEQKESAKVKELLDKVKKIPVSPRALPFLTSFITGIEKGEPQAFWNLGESFLRGKLGISDAFPKDKDSALFWFHRSAELESSSSQYNLGVMYLGDIAWQLGMEYSEDVAVDKNFDEALKWLNKAANQSDTFSASAQDVLGEIYFQGIGVNQDHAKAFDLFSKAAANPRSVSNKFGVSTRASERLPLLKAEGYG